MIVSVPGEKTLTFPEKGRLIAKFTSEKGGEIVNIDRLKEVVESNRATGNLEELLLELFPAMQENSPQAFSELVQEVQGMDSSEKIVEKIQSMK